jgi:hypothetical protein
MISELKVNFVKSAIVAIGLFVTLLLLMEFFMAISEIASANVPVRKARLGERDRSVSGSQHIPGGTHDHQFGYLMYQIAAVQDDVDDSTPVPTTATPVPGTSLSSAPEDETLERIRETGGGSGGVNRDQAPINPVN